MKKFGRFMKRKAVPIICVIFAFLVLWGNDLIPWYSGTLESIYRKQLANVTVEAAFIEEMDGYKVTNYTMQKDGKKIEDLINYLYSLRLRSKFLQTYETGDSSIELTLFHSDPLVSIVFNIINENTIEVYGIPDLPNYRNHDYVYIVKGGVNIDFIRSCFEGAQDLTNLYN